MRNESDGWGNKSHRHLGIPFLNGRKVSSAGQSKSQTASSTPTSIGARNQQPPLSNQFDSYNFPTIEWKPKLIAGALDGIAQLSTTMETKPSGIGSCFFTEVKARLRLPSCSNANSSRGWTITLLDKNGFRLADVQVFQLHQIAGTEILEGQASEHGLTESDYRKAVDCSVSPK